MTVRKDSTNDTEDTADSRPIRRLGSWRASAIRKLMMPQPISIPTAASRLRQIKRSNVVAGKAETEQIEGV